MSGEQRSPPRLTEAPAHLERARPHDAVLGRSLALVRFLRDRCPWDARQTPRSLKPYLLEEAHETAEAILEGDDHDLARELGDLLLNLAFQVVLAEERGAFDADTVVGALEAKMRERHPHVYGDAEEAPDWEALKARERAERESAAEAGSSDPFEGVAGGIDPLSRALRFQDRAAAWSFDWPGPDGALEKLREEVEELAAAFGGADPRGPEAIEEEIGDVLFAAVNVARLAELHPGTSLERATAKFADRFRAVARLARERGLDPRGAGLEVLDGLWDEIKATRGARPPEE
jgi:MazG family protein